MTTFNQLYYIYWTSD